MLKGKEHGQYENGEFEMCERIVLFLIWTLSLGNSCYRLTGLCWKNFLMAFLLRNYQKY